uniref:Uncharacterized protein n=1 Tax=Heliothis virescens TaxID=7102 RepID=A0A2A4JDL2_HELVI
MDNSQSSDFLSESTDMFCNSPTDEGTMDIITYESLVSNTKTAFSAVGKEIKKSSFSVYFSTLLNDCSTCITQSLELITDLLAETNLKQSKLKEYMNDAVCLLQLLSDLIKQVIETMSMACCSMKTFPIVTGHIIRLVFIHCKDSESLYGSQLSYVEKQLKDLFRTCHELQLTYLMVLEKHFIFDLTEREEQDILIEALDINLKIGEIVQSLDVKTMAEQWKAYTMICDKYSNCLMDKRIYTDCTKILCSMVTNNIKTALEENQEEKVVLRSLKVSSFTLKILLRVCNTFKHAVIKDYSHIVEFLIYVHLNNEACLHTMRGKPAQFINIFNNNVSNPVSLLLAELLMDEKLLACIWNYNINEIRRDEKLLGVILLVISVIKVLVQKSADHSLNVPKQKFINLIYNILPNCHIWFNIGLKFKCEKASRQYQTYGLFEHLLTHTLALTATMNAEEINILEKKMVEAILSTDCLSAMFFGTLWVLLARISNRQFLLTQVISLCKTYQKLENNYLFVDSPQKVHLSHTISRLFKEMHNDDKIKVYNMFSINEDNNLSLWVCLKLNNLPNEVQLDGEMIVMEKVKVQMRAIMSADDAVDVDDLIKVINLASTCSIVNREDEMEIFLLHAWSKACPKSILHIVKRLDKGAVWYYRYIEAMVALTNSMEHIFHGNSANLVKVLHIISNIVQSGCKELKLLLISILCKLANLETFDMNKHRVETELTRAFSELFHETDCTVKNKLYSTLRKNRSNALDRITAKIVNEDDSLKETWSCFIRKGKLKKDELDVKEHLLSTIDFQYTHKCIEHVDEFRDSGSVKMQKSLSNNFDLVDIDSLFDTESDAEPACKKAKLNTNEVEQIISRLETDTSSLCKIKENIFTTEYLNRIKSVCNKLKSILD